MVKDRGVTLFLKGKNDKVKADFSGHMDTIRLSKKRRAGRRCDCSEGLERDHTSGFVDERRGCEPRSVGRS